MLYPAYIHPGDAKHAFGIQFPDLPGCFFAADDENEIMANTQEAVETHFADGEIVPPPSSA